jgi:hypothetical protein
VFIGMYFPVCYDDVCGWVSKAGKSILEKTITARFVQRI